MAAITVFTITNAVGNGTTSTYTGTITSGTSPLVSGTPIIVAGCITAGFNGNFLINGGNLTTTFTCLSATNHVSEAESGATGRYDPETTSINLGYGFKTREVAPSASATALGNYIPGTLPGGGQQVIVF